MSDIETSGEYSASGEQVWPRTVKTERFCKQCLEKDKQLAEALNQISTLKQQTNRLRKVVNGHKGDQLPTGYERKVLALIKYPENGELEWRVIWWKHRAKCFSFGRFGDANSMVVYWQELPKFTA